MTKHVPPKVVPNKCSRTRWYTVQMRVCWSQLSNIKGIFVFCVYTILIKHFDPGNDINHDNYTCSISRIPKSLKTIHKSSTNALVFFRALKRSILISYEESRCRYSFLKPWYLRNKHIDLSIFFAYCSSIICEIDKILLSKKVYDNKMA